VESGSVEGKRTVREGKGREGYKELPIVLCACVV